MHTKILTKIDWKFKRVSLALLLTALMILVGCKQDRTQVDPEPAFDLEPFKEYVMGKDQATESYGQLGKTVTALKDGSIVAVWEQGESSSRDVMIQWLKPNGERVFGDTGEFVSQAPAEQSLPAVAAHPESGVYVSFLQDTGESLASMLQYYNSDAQPVWPEPMEVTIEQHFSYKYHDYPTLVPDQSGGVYVCFTHYDGIKGKEDIACQHIDQNGTRLWGNAPVFAGSRPGLKNYPCAVPDGQGGVLVFWRNMRNFDSPETDYMFFEGQHFNADGQRLWGEQGKIVYNTNHPFAGYTIFGEYKILSDGKGGAVLTMRDWLNHGTDELDVVAQRISQDGDMLWGNGVVVNADPGHQGADALIPTNDGGAYIVVNESKNLDDFGRTLYLNKISPDGQHLFPTPGIQLNTPGVTKEQFWVEGHFNGQTLVLTWTQQLQYASQKFDMVLCRLNADGSFIDPEGGFVLVNEKGAQIPHGLVFNSKTNTYFIAYDDTRESENLQRSDVYGAHFKPDIEAKTQSTSPTQSPQYYPANTTPPISITNTPPGQRIKKAKVH